MRSLCCARVHGAPRSTLAHCSKFSAAARIWASLSGSRVNDPHGLTMRMQMVTQMLKAFVPVGQEETPFKVCCSMVNVNAGWLCTRRHCRHGRAF